MTTYIEVFGKATVVIDEEEREGNAFTLDRNGQFADITHANGQRRGVLNDDDNQQAVVTHTGGRKVVKQPTIDPISLQSGLTVTDRRDRPVLHVRYARPGTPRQ